MCVFMPSTLSFLYQALAVIEYLVSHGSERAVDDIIEHTFQISVRTISIILNFFGRYEVKNTVECTQTSLSFGFFGGEGSHKF